MPAPNVDLVFVLDGSASMAPCFKALQANLKALTAPMQGQVGRIHYGLVAACATRVAHAQAAHRIRLLEPDLRVSMLYHPSQDLRGRCFTDQPETLLGTLDTVTPQGDEDMLLALDIAADFPFGPLGTTKRVIALFSDEPFETGIDQGHSAALLPQLINKLQARHIQLFCALPDGATAQALSEADRSEIELVTPGSGLSSVDFSKLLSQMGRNISVSVLQGEVEAEYERALFGQDQWVDTNVETWHGR